MTNDNEFLCLAVDPPLDDLVEQIRANASEELIEAAVAEAGVAGLDALPIRSMLALNTESLWKANSAISVQFLNGDDHERWLFREAAKQWLVHVNLSFTYPEQGAGDIRVKFDGGSSEGWSYYGISSKFVSKDEPSMMIGTNFLINKDKKITRVLLHEIGHALGCYHEHQNPNLNIDWAKEVVYAEMALHGWSREKTDHNILKRVDAGKAIASTADSHSIMAYPIPLYWTHFTYSTSENYRLTSMDQDFIRSVYPGSTIDVYHRGWGDQKNLYRVSNKSLDPRSWGADTEVAGVGVWASPAAIEVEERRYVFHQGIDNEVLWWCEVSKTPPADESTTIRLSESPGLVESNNTIHVFYQNPGLSGDLSVTEFVQSADGNLTAVRTEQNIVTAGMSKAPSAVVFKGQLLVFFQGYGENGQLHCLPYVGEGGRRQPPFHVTGTADNIGMSEAPSAVVFGDTLYVFFQEWGKQGHLVYTTSTDGKQWSGPTTVTPAGGEVRMSCSPSAVVAQGGSTLAVFHQGHDRNGSLWYTSTTDGRTWTPDVQVPGTGMSETPCAVHL